MPVTIVTLLLCAICFSIGPALAQFTHPDSNPQTNWDIRKTYFLRFPAAAQHGPAVQDNPEGHDIIEDKRSQRDGTVQNHASGPVFSWPVTIPTAESQVPTKRDEAIQMNLFQTFGYPVSDTQFQIIERYNQNRFLEQLYDPEKVMWLSTSIGSIQANSAGNSAANMAVNQNITAIEYCAAPILNFTIDDGNVWNRLRNELFIPMAVLLLLPGAVLAQVRAIVAQGSPAIVGEVNPFEGIIRSIVAIFLIPGSYLVVNYGIDVSNSIRHTISSEFQRIFGADMYELAKCSIKRSYVINDPRSNRNAIEHSETPHIENHDVWAPYESLSLGLRIFDPCLGVDESRVPDEDVRQVKPVNRLLVNAVGAAEGLTWNIMCAFQVVFLYYLWCMGPIAAALSVWPLSQLRDAFKNWCEGVIVVCFWTLFWHTIILLLAAFKGVGDTGSLYVSALLMMAIQAVKSAFDFAGLVGSASGMASQMANKAMQGGGGGGGSGGGRQSAGTQGAPGAAAAASGGGADSATRTPSAPALDGAGPSAVGTAGLAGSLGSGGQTGGTGLSISGSGQMTSDITGGADLSASAGGQLSADAGITGAGDAAGLGSATDGQAGAMAPDPGVPPSASGPKSGGAEEGGIGAALGAIGGLAAAGAALGDKAGMPPMSSDAMLNYSATINKLGQSGNIENLADMSLNKDLSQLTPGAIMDAMTNSSTNLNKIADGVFGDAVGGEGIRDQLNKFDQAVLGGAGVGILDTARDMSGMDPATLAQKISSGELDPGMLSEQSRNALQSLGVAALPPDAGPLTSELGLNRTSSEFGQSDILSNGIDKDFAHNPQAELARSAAQDLMNIDADPNQDGVQPLVSQEMLRDALNGDQNAISAIDKNLGVSPEVLNAALHGDSGSASLLLAASGHRAMDDPGSALHRAAADGNYAAVEALKIAPQTHEDTIMAAAHGNPVAAAQALHNSADTQSWMASRDVAVGELQGAGIPGERFKEAMSGDPVAQAEVSRAMGLGEGNFDVVRGAVGGDRQDAATLMAARGTEEMRNMSPEQIQQAVQQGDPSILAARSTSPDVLQRALGGDQDARQMIQDGVASDPVLLQSASTGNFESMRAISAMTGERPDVLAAASTNAQNIMGLFSDPGQVHEAMTGTPDQRHAFIDQVANQMQVSPHILRDAVGGDSTASATMLAVAGHHGHVANLARDGNPLARAAMATQQTVDIDTLRAASTGNESAQFAVQNAVAGNTELNSMARSGSPEAVMAVHATQSVTDGGGMALGREVNPFGPGYAASMEAQATLQDLGVDPTAYVRGDANAQSQVFQTLGIEPGSSVAQSMHSTVNRALHGDGGAAATLMAAAGRTEPVQQLARQGDLSAQAAVVASHSVPDGVLHSAVEGNTGAQAYLQNEVSVSPHMMSLAGQGNEQAILAVQSSHGAEAIGNISASANTQNLMGYFADSQTVQTALYGQGAERATAMTGIADRMGVSPQVLNGAIHGSATMASVAFVKASHQEPVRRAAESGDVLARAVQSTAAGQNMSVVEMAATGNPQAAEAVNQSIRESQLLQNLAVQGNPEAAAVRAVGSSQQDPSVFGPTQEALSRNVVVPDQEQRAQLDQTRFTVESGAGTAYGYAAAQPVGSWGDIGGNTVSYSGDAYRGAGDAQYVSYAADGRPITVDTAAPTFVPASAGMSQEQFTVDSRMADAGAHRGNLEHMAPSRELQRSSYEGGVQPQTGQLGPDDRRVSNEAPGAPVDRRISHDLTQAPQAPIEPTQHRGNIENLSRDMSGDSSGLSTGGASPYSRISDRAPESVPDQGGFSSYRAEASPPDSSPRYGGGQQIADSSPGYSQGHQPGGNEAVYRQEQQQHQQRQAEQAQQAQHLASAGGAHDRASELRSEPDPGMLAQRGPETANYGRSSVDEGQGGGDLIAYNQGGPTAPQESSLGKTLRDALPGAAGGLAGGLAAQFPQGQRGGAPGSREAELRNRQAGDKSQMDSRNQDMQRRQEIEETKRRQAEQDRVRNDQEQARERKKAEQKRYRDKVQSEIDEIEAEAERRREEEGGETT